MRKIALIPVYNEESTLLSVLDPLSRQVDLIVIVDDGSTDRSHALAESWAQVHGKAKVLRLRENHGMSSALREGFLYVVSLLERRELDPNDVLLTLDADGQHDSRVIAALCDHMERQQLDVALTRRDFALYPVPKRIGNQLMTLWGRLWSGFRYFDVESGFRAVRIKVLPPLLRHYIGYRYSCAQEIAILTARLGFRVDNRFNTVIQMYRSQTSILDVFINAALGLWAFARWALRREAAHSSRAAVPFKPKGGIRQRLLDHVFFPLNVWFSEETSHKLGLTPIDCERVRAVLPYCRGKLLDVACGNNLLVSSYGQGVGVDIHPYPGIAVRCDSSQLPFKGNTFDSLTLLACLNHITRRRETLDECRRVLKSGGRLLITMIPAWVGIISHPIRKRHDPDQLKRGLAQNEDWGLSTGEIRALLAESGFRITAHRRFMWGLNNFYIAEKTLG